MNQQAHISLIVVIPVLAFMVLSPLSVKAVTSGSNSASAGNGVATASNEHCTVSAGHGKVSIVCKPACPPGNNGTPSTEDNPSEDEAVGEKGGSPQDPVVSGSCFPNGEDEPSLIEETTHDPPPS